MKFFESLQRVKEVLLKKAKIVVNIEIEILEKCTSIAYKGFCMRIYEVSQRIYSHPEYIVDLNDHLLPLQY
jgi:hypothetical protein